MPAFRWLGPLRNPARRHFYRLLRAALETDEGRAVLADTSRGLAAGISPVRLMSADDDAAEFYPDLGQAQPSPHERPAPVFITARFRSGSTLLWNLFRHVPDCTAYYEPLNERRWFDPATRGNRVDATHIGVDDYWREYEGLENLSALYRDSWPFRQLFMDERAWDPALQAYIGELISAARGTAVLQFNRIDFRLPWLRHTFPQARIIHLFRHPRDQWCSSLVNLSEYTSAQPIEEFAAHDHYYLLAWARDLRHQFPFLDPATAGHAYRVFYFIWKLSYLFGRSCAHASFCYERLVAEPERVVPQVMHAAGVCRYDMKALASCIAASSAGKWKQYADDGWFRGHEVACEKVLGRFLSNSEFRIQNSDGYSRGNGEERIRNSEGR